MAITETRFRPPAGRDQFRRALFTNTMTTAAAWSLKRRSRPS